MKALAELNGWTDYPFNELGDIPHQIAPIRQCKVVSYDRNKYAHVIVGGIETSIKRGYIYKQPGRCGMVQGFKTESLHRLPIDWEATT